MCTVNWPPSRGFCGTCGRCLECGHGSQPYIITWAGTKNSSDFIAVNGTGDLQLPNLGEEQE